MDPDFLLLGLIWYVVFLLSLTCHEAAHALTAKWGGDPTAFHAGQVTLNPAPHMRREPFGTILVPLLSYIGGGGMIGWASAPYDPFWQQRHPRRAAWMSLAGPAANFLLALGAAVLIHIGILLGFLRMPASVGFTRIVAADTAGAAEGLAVFLSILFSLNVLLGVFNLLPFPPLDGYSALGLFTSERGAMVLENFRRTIAPYAGIGLLLSWTFFDRIFDPVFRIALNLLYPFARYS